MSYPFRSLLYEKDKTETCEVSKTFFMLLTAAIKSASTFFMMASSSAASGHTKTWTMCCLLHWSPKFCNESFLIRCLHNFGDFIQFWWLVHLVECSNVSTTNCNLQKLLFGVYALGMISINWPLSYPFRSQGQQCRAWEDIRL